MILNLLKNYLALVNRIFVYFGNPDTKDASKINAFKTVSILINRRSIKTMSVDAWYFNRPVSPKPIKNSI